MVPAVTDPLAPTGQQVSPEWTVDYWNHQITVALNGHHLLCEDIIDHVANCKTELDNINNAITTIDDSIIRARTEAARLEDEKATLLKERRAILASLQRSQERHNQLAAVLADAGTKMISVVSLYAAY